MDWGEKHSSNWPMNKNLKNVEKIKKWPMNKTSRMWSKSRKWPINKTSRRGKNQRKWPVGKTSRKGWKSRKWPRIGLIPRMATHLCMSMCTLWVLNLRTPAPHHLNLVQVTAEETHNEHIHIQTHYIWFSAYRKISIYSFKLVLWQTQNQRCWSFQ